jgi:phage terminase small subunit
MNVLCSFSEVINKFKRFNLNKYDDAYEQFLKSYDKFKKENNNTIISEEHLEKLDLIVSNEKNLKTYQMTLNKIMSDIMVLIQYEVQ